MSGSRVYIFAGGGTGGHLYPGLAIWESLQERLGPGASCLFICSNRAIDREILQAAGVDFVPSSARPIGLRPGVLARFLMNWGHAVREGRRAIARARAGAGPGGRVEVVAMGGFVAAPIVQAARAERCPLTLVNLDAVPGKANRWIARTVSHVGGRAFTTFKVDAPYARSWRTISPIVRRAARVDRTTAQARAELGLDADRPVLLVTGGSQGAASINAFVTGLASASDRPLQGWQVLHQSGQDDQSPLESAYAAAGAHAVVRKFEPRIGLWWRAAELAIGRAGAGSVAEAWANGVPTLFMPYPYHRDQHQRLNARVLTDARAALVLDDHIDAGKNLAAHADTLRALLRSGADRAAMRSALAGLGPVDGAQRVAEALAQN
jgi:UDP-N-acetylglucosamine--N-acetylmuramyl-(pentapeptide) pyrophosphoryl-undecaprenol N-acetylglucosamine transferase